MIPTAKFTLQTTLGIVLALAVMPAVSAQTQAERERAENDRELEIRIWNLRNLSEQSRKYRKKRRNVQQALSQIGDDFVRLQSKNRQ